MQVDLAVAVARRRLAAREHTRPRSPQLAFPIRPRRPGTLAPLPLPYHLIAELRFNSAEELQATTGSDAGRAVSRDLKNFAAGGATFLIAAVD